MKRTKSELDNFVQVSCLNDRETTNATIMKFNPNGSRLKYISDYFHDSNMRCVFQKRKVSGYHASSFEEALILQNYDNVLLNKALSKTKPKIYNSIVGNPVVHTKLLLNSFRFQSKLSSDKSDFANNMLYEFIIREDGNELPLLPEYIQDGLLWLRYKIQDLFSREVNK